VPTTTSHHPSAGSAASFLPTPATPMAQERCERRKGVVGRRRRLVRASARGK
jgi:hypothetical protein